MSKSNEEEEEDSLPPNQNTKPLSSSSQRPPLLAKSKTLTELLTTTATGPGGAETNPLFSTVGRINTLTTSASASSRPSDHPLRVSVSSSIGLDQSSSASYFSYPNRTRVHAEPRSTNPNPDRPIVVVGDVKSAASPENHRIAARNDINSRDSDSETDKLMVSQSSSASQASSVSQLAARRTRELNQSFILYLIWEDILGFENAEFYIKRWPELDGLHFKDVLISFPDAVPCGIKVAAEGGKIDINPDDDYVLKEGDEVLVIAEDDDTYAPDHLPEVCRGFFPKIPDPPKYPEKILFCGWRRDIDDMIMVLETFLASGSQLWMFNEVPEKEREKKLTDGGLDVSRLENIKLVHREGNAVIRRHLENLPLETFDSILILADESLEDSVVQADSQSLATLLLIRDIQSKRLPHKDTKSNSLRFSGFSHSSWIRQMQQASDKSIIISEILDSRTRNLVSVSRISDYVLSNELVSMALAMVAEDKQINRVLEELFAEKGSEMCITPAEFYLFDQEELCFYDIMIRGRQRQEIVIGYRTANAECAIINPPQKSEPRKWAIDDVFVVISSGE